MDGVGRRQAAPGLEQGTYDLQLKLGGNLTLIAPLGA